MPHADWLITGLEKSSCPLKKFILPARENIVQIKFLRKLKLIMPYCDDEEHSRVSFTVLEMLRFKVWWKTRIADNKLPKKLIHYIFED